MIVRTLSRRKFSEMVEKLERDLAIFEALQARATALRAQKATYAPGSLRGVSFPLEGERERREGKA